MTFFFWGNKKACNQQQQSHCNYCNYCQPENPECLSLHRPPLLFGKRAAWISQCWNPFSIKPKTITPMLIMITVC